MARTMPFNAPRCSGADDAIATVSPSAVNTDVEQSARSLIFGEYAARIRPASISSATAASELLITSSSVTPLPLIGLLSGAGTQRSSLEQQTAARVDGRPYLGGHDDGRIHLLHDRRTAQRDAGRQILPAVDGTRDASASFLEEHRAALDRRRASAAGPRGGRQRGGRGTRRERE